MLSIGEFSRATALTVKTLRHYHERGILIPARVDAGSGYRSYDEANLERARVIKALRALEFSLGDIAAILEDCDDDADALDFLEQHRTAIGAQLTHLQHVHDSLEHVIRTQKEARAIMNEHSNIEDKTIPPQLVAGIRMRGRFEQSKDGFKRLGRAFGFSLAGKPGMLIYDEEYKEDDADFEVFFPVKKRKEVGEDVAVRELPGGRAVTLVHRGPYDRISEVYAQLLQAIHDRKLRPLSPSREVYIKGPGMLFQGNPEKYLTEVQIFVEPT